MRISHYRKWLQSGYALDVQEAHQARGEEIVKTGVLTRGTERYPIIDCIPRFVPAGNYADTFGLQWNRFRESFDYVFCYGVLQHTPDPKKAFLSIVEYLKPGGKLSVDLYRKYRLPSPYSTAKYLWRPVTRRMNPETLLRIIRFYVPFWLPVQNFLCRIPRIGGYIAALIPIPCWVHLRMGLSWRQQVDWSIMNTFDALSPAYDFPQTEKSVTGWCSLAPLGWFEVFRGSNGLVANGIKC